MFTALKKRIDRAAIDIAARSLPPGIPSANRTNQAKELLSNEKLLRPAGETGRLQFNGPQEFQFQSAVKTNHARNDVVYGRLFRTGSAWASRPTVILVHGWNAELHYLYILPRLARALNQAGMNAAQLELPYHMHRRPTERNGMRDFISDDLPGMLQATRQAISDIDSLGRWVAAQGCPAVGVWGFSLGAWLAGLYICESRFASAAVLTTPVSNLARGVAELSFCHPIRSSLNGMDLDLGRLNLQRKRPQIPVKAIEVVQSIYDLFVPEETYLELAQAWNLQDWTKEPHGHISVLTSRQAMKRSIDWLEKSLRG